ncbi:DNA-binding protein [Emericellopsis atlantica]|uniref:DNA-binding protein n=1 Tax=Emericellopsis atlantica TaxID=2614577 RepID=A0A9P7ZQ02_9HYPO|nr:DNA-binding protein [Emericellopsis atlantica]KAG9255727.1 DNA-binding protein [Emericellopsis atlantica]
MATDLEQLLDMGFEEARAKLAVKKSGGLQGALEWLETNQDKTLEQIQESSGGQDDEDEDATKAKIAELEAGTEAKSMVCNECGKKFRSMQAAEFHASKTEHTDFSESAEEIAPLTEEEKAARLAELREKVKSKKAASAIQDKEEARRNEQIRQKSTKETQEAKEELQRKEQIKEAARKRQEKLDDLEAKRRIKAKIEADKAERKRKADEAKAAREGKAAPVAESKPSAAPAAPKAKVDHDQARLRLQTASGNIMKTLPAETTLFELAEQLKTETGTTVTSFSTTFPKKTFEGDVDMSKTLKEAGFVPSSVLIVK